MINIKKTGKRVHYEQDVNGGDSDSNAKKVSGSTRRAGFKKTPSIEPWKSGYGTIDFASGDPSVLIQKIEKSK